MNKLIVLIAVVCSLEALAVLASPVEVKDESASSWAIFPSDEEETAQLKPYHKVFSDYCLQSRDFIKASFKNSIDDSLKTFGSLINPFTALETFKKISKPGKPNCDGLLAVKKELKKRFDQYKSELSKEIGDNPNTTFEWVMCLSTHRLIFYADHCELLVEYVNLNYF